MEEGQHSAANFKMIATMWRLWCIFRCTTRVITWNLYVPHYNHTCHGSEFQTRHRSVQILSVYIKSCQSRVDLVGVLWIQLKKQSPMRYKSYECLTRQIDGTCSLLGGFSYFQLVSISQAKAAIWWYLISHHSFNWFILQHEAVVDWY